MDENNIKLAVAKLLIAWLGTMFGGFTLSGMVLFSTLVYTILQTYILARDQIVNKVKKSKGKP